jgi:acetylornithine/N-succinyldiaminopimelate aminotransferase
MTNPIMPTYGRLDVAFVRGEGVWLWDENDNRYLDALSGIAVCGLGHAHPAVHKAICEQSAKLLHTSNIYRIPAQEKLAEKLIEKSGMTNVFFCNSGAEANEAAIKLARKFGHQRGIDRPAIIVTEGSFHGRTLATLSATGNAKIQKGFEPLVEGFLRVPYDDVNAIKDVLAKNDAIVAILVEPVQGEGGINIPANDYLNQIRALCDQHNLLMMLDEIQSGMGRTGKFMAYQHNGILPDVCTLAKALGNGVPIGACLAAGKAATIFNAGNHGSTFGGNPLACSAALAVLDTLDMDIDNLIAQAASKGQAITTAFKQNLKNNKHVTDIRNKGLMIGIELDASCVELVKMALTEGLLINVTQDKVIRLLPPLIIDETQINLLTSQLSLLITQFTEQLAITHNATETLSQPA